MTILIGRDDPSEDPTLAAVRPDDLSAYLASRGWRQVGEMHHMGRWIIPGQEDLQVLAPLDTGYADFKRRIYELIRDLSAVEDRSPDSVLRDLLSARVDTIRVRVRPRDAQDGTSIPLRDGVTLIEQTRNLLAAAARSEDHHRMSHPGGQPPKPVHDYLANARLGQTEQGSYVLAIMSPVLEPAEAAQPELIPEEVRPPSFARRATRTLAGATKAARDLAESVARHDVPLDRFLGLIEEGVSANLCESLVAIGKVQSEGGFSLAFDWAPLYPAPGAVTAVEFGDELIPVLDRAARRLRNLDEGEYVLQGRIGDLRDRSERSLWQIAVVPAQGAPGRVWVRLTPDQFSRASLAVHNEEHVRIRGRLVRDRGRWELADPHDFTVLER